MEYSLSFQLYAILLLLNANMLRGVCWVGVTRILSLSRVFGSFRYVTRIAPVCTTTGADGFPASISSSSETPCGPAVFDTHARIFATSLVNPTWRAVREDEPGRWWLRGDGGRSVEYQCIMDVFTLSSLIAHVRAICVNRIKGSCPKWVTI